jgi:pantetheine-phosphate adenylyltransferase
VLVNEAKQGLFTVPERIDMLTEVTKEHTNVRVLSFRGLLVDFCHEHGAQIVVKGVRVVGDFEYELQMAQMNIGLSGVETLFMPTNPLYSFIASSLVKEVAKWGGDVSTYVPELVEQRLAERLRAARAN